MVKINYFDSRHHAFLALPDNAQFIDLSACNYPDAIFCLLLDVRKLGNKADKAFIIKRLPELFSDALHCIYYDHEQHEVSASEIQKKIHFYFLIIR